MVNYNNYYNYKEKMYLYLIKKLFDPVNRCSNCDSYVSKEERFCGNCGFYNVLFSEEVFIQENEKTLEQWQEEECKKSHPANFDVFEYFRSYDDQFILSKKWYCTECGKLLYDGNNWLD